VAARRSIAPASLVEQYRSDVASGDGAVNSSGYRWWHGQEDDLVSLADDPDDPVAVFLAEVADVQAGGFEDP
jgi:hypothetical protein